METVSLPSSLPCLVLQNQILLPTAFAKLSFTSEQKRFTDLLEYLNHGQKNAYIAIVPGTAGHEEEHEEEGDTGSVQGVQQDMVGAIATAARVLQLSRVVQTGDLVLLLEGVCRVRLDAVSPGEKSGQPMDMVQISQLEMKPGALTPHQAPGMHHTSSSGDDTHSSDVSAAELGKQLRATMRALLRHVSRGLSGNAGAAPSRRLLEMLSSVPGWRAADIVSAALTTNYQERLAVLRAVDPRQRLRLAVNFAQRALDAFRAASSGHTSSAAAATSMTHSLWKGISGSGNARSRSTQGLPSLGSLGNKHHDADDDDDDVDGLDSIMAKLTAAKPPTEVAKAAMKEYKKLKQAGDMQPGAAASRAFLETLADLPWSRTAADVAAEEAAGKLKSLNAATPSPTPSTASGTHPGHRERVPSHSANDSVPPLTVSSDVKVPHGAPLSLRAAKELLDKQHYGLDKVKDRVVEHLAVMRLKGSTARAPILCFIGPPGVGKTSLARSVAEVLGRPFIRISLGGVRDEAEVRGHRRTYVGAMPGRVVNALRRARCCDPVMLLDELDKLGKDTIRGDPSAALLEVLDPEQNSAFVDAYLGLPVDLSKVTFVATANRASDIPAPLLDRLEVVTLSGYTLEEKVHIGKQHLIPKQVQEHGLAPGQVHFPDEVLEFVIDRYTREAGVRNLARNVAAICRHVAVSIVSAAEAAVSSDWHQHQHHSDYPASQPHDDQHHAQHSAHAKHATGTVSSAASVYGGVLYPPDMSQQKDGESHQPAIPQHVRSVAGHDAIRDGKQLPDDWPYCQGCPQHTAVLDGMSLAGISEAPLDAFAVSQQQTAHSQGRLNQPIQSASGRNSVDIQATQLHSNQQQQPNQNFMSRVLGGFRSAPAAQHNAQQQQQSRTSISQKSNAKDMQDVNQTAERVGALLSGLSGHVGFSGRQQAHSVQSQSVPYHGVPQAFPYPPDLLQQHGALTVTQDLVETVLGPPRYEGPADSCQAVSLPGAAAGLVWTAVGGSVQYIEVARISTGSVDRPGSLTLTGQVGEVLDESARIALSWIRAHAQQLDLAGSRRHSRTSQLELPTSSSLQANKAQHDADADDAIDPALAVSRDNTSGQHERGGVAMRSSQAGNATGTRKPHDVHVEIANLDDLTAGATSTSDLRRSRDAQESHVSPALHWDLHVHLPAGAIPKDGPSAGITLAVALISAMSGRTVRSDTAMTGEVTLRGLVLPVGGIKEKLIAARQAGMKRVIIPFKNMRDVAAEVPATVRDNLIIIPAERLEEVLAAAFDPPYVLKPAPALQSKL